MNEFKININHPVLTNFFTIILINLGYDVNYDHINHNITYHNNSGYHFIVFNSLKKSICST